MHSSIIPSTFRYGVDHLTPEIALGIARKEIQGILVDEAKRKIKQSHEAVQKILQDEKPVYSINTGFGSLCQVRISSQDSGRLQENLLKSHSAGVGNPIKAELTRLMLILKVHALSQGYSGVSLPLVDRLLWHLEKDYLSLVPEQGSVGASGDLCPLAHLFLPLLGLGFLTHDDGKSYVPASEILTMNKLRPFKLGAKEGLALINGTQFMTAHAVKIAEYMGMCLDHADLIATLSLEGYLGSSVPFDPRLHQIRPHPGAIYTANRIRTWLEGSEFLLSHKNCTRVQDPYSIRCIPQIHGAIRDVYSHFLFTLNIELNSVTDNPLIFSEQFPPEALSGGGFHGEPLALVLDSIGLAASQLGNISDRRIFLLLGEQGEWGLPLYLIKGSGLNSGFMISQYTSAALVSENKSLCYPASADSIPTSNGIEDLVSMGPIAARKTLKILENLEKILGIELVCACQAMDFRRPLKSSPILEQVHAHVRQTIPFIQDDTVLSPLLNEGIRILQSRELLKIVADT